MSSMRLPRLEPSNKELAFFLAVSDLESLVAYLDDPESPRRLRRRVVLKIAGLKPGGGETGAFFGTTDPIVIPILGPLLENDPDPSVRRAAAYGLRRTGDPAAIGPLLDAVSDSDEATRTHALLGLGDLKARQAVDPIIKLLEDERCAVMAAQALAKIGDERALGFLRLAASESGSARRIKQLHSALIDLERRVGLHPSE
jgi:HEAT repeat protein